MSLFDNYVFNNYVLNQFKREVGLSSSEWQQDIWKFRFVCYKLNFFMKHVVLPPIQTKSYYEAVLIEFRILPHLEFIIRNAIFHLGNKWSFTVVCGTHNHSFIQTICAQINPKIRIIQLPYTNRTQEEYSNLLMTIDFWHLFHGEKLFIYQEDSLFFQSNVDRYLSYDFIGAPFHKMSNDTPNGVGNGGFSLRTKCKMIEVLETCPRETIEIPSSTQSYMNYVGMTTIPEDVYFSTCLQQKRIGEVASWENASYFSSEQVFNQHSLGGHKFWISNPGWKTFLKKLFQFYEYVPRSDLNEYLNHRQLPYWLNKTKEMANAFDIDISFFCRVNNIKFREYISCLEKMLHIECVALDGFVYHPKQIFNLFPSAKLYMFKENMYIYEHTHKQVFPIQDFISKYMYNVEFEYFCDLALTKKYDTMNDNYDTCLLVFLGNEEIALTLIQKIIEYKKIQKKFNVAFCINTFVIRERHALKQLIRENFDFYAIYYSTEFGTDITPTLCMYYHIQKTHKVRHIIKLHTKTVTDMYTKLTDYVLSMPVAKLKKHRTSGCNCVGHPELYKRLKDDKFNKELVTRHRKELNEDGSFVMGTIFYTEERIINAVIEFVRRNPRPYMLNNLYENNSINQRFSPIHFLERLFGTIQC